MRRGASGLIDSSNQPPGAKDISSLPRSARASVTPPVIMGRHVVAPVQQGRLLGVKASGPAPGFKIQRVLKGFRLGLLSLTMMH